MRVLLIGSACGRLSCLAEALREGNPALLSILTNYSNPSLSTVGSVTTGNPADPDVVERWVKSDDHMISRHGGDAIALISDEAPLAAGVVDRLQALGIPTVGPTKALTIEASKIDTRELLERHGIPGNPLWRAFGAGRSESLSHMDVWMESLSDQVVIKPDGLTGGKGVWVYGDHFHTRSEGLDYCRQIIKSGSGLIIEEKLFGEEFSLQSAYDGETIVHCFPVQDCKRLLDGDLGPNTGGMGSWASSHQLPPWLLEPNLKIASVTNEWIVRVLQEETGQTYRGIIYGSYIVCPPGIIKLIEVNCRFGDSEVMNVLALLEKPKFATLCKAIATGTLHEHEVSFRPGFSVVKYLVPEGHPTNPVADVPVHTDGIGFNRNLRIYNGSLIRVGRGDVTNYCTTGSRAVAMVGIGDTIEEAEQIAEKAACEVPGPLFHRKDIATSAFFARRNKRFADLCRDMVT